MDTPILTSHLSQVDIPLGDAYIRFQIDQQTHAILAIEYAQEVLIIPSERITPMPNASECVLGLLNRRNRVLWVIDLAQILNLQPLDTNAQNYHVAIIQVGKSSLGLAVQEVKGIARFTSDCIQSPIGVVTSTLIPYLHGCILQQQEILLVLNVEAIMHSDMLNSDWI